MSETLRQDVRQALRGLARTPGFTAAAVLTMGLAVGANASIFSLLNALTLRPLPVDKPEQLIAITTAFRSGQEAPLSFPMFIELGRRQTVLSSMIGWFGSPVLAVEANGDLSSATIVGVTGNFHSELGVTPFLGRTLQPADIDLERFSGAPVAVLGHGFWQRRFAGDTAALGRVVRVQGVPFTVVGIAPPGFKGLGLLAEPDVTVPLTAYPDLFRSRELNHAHAGNVLWMKAVGRLRTDVPFDQARAQLETSWPGVKAAVVPATHAGAQRDNFLAMPLRVTSFATGQELFLRARFTRPLYVVLGVALVVLLIACVNLAGAMLPRVAGRAHELAVRTALGASRWQAGRLVLIEAMAIGVAGGCCGLGVSYWAGAALGAALLPPAPVPLQLDTAPDVRVLAFTAATAIVAGLVSAAVPAWRATRRDVHDTLQRQRQTPGGPGRSGRALIAAHVALSVVILINAGLLVRSLQALLAVEPGFAVEGVRLANFQRRPEAGARPDPGVYYPALLEQVNATPGADRSSIALGALANGAYVQEVSPMEGRTADGVPAAFNSVSPGFFRSLDIDIVAGRDFAWADRPDAPGVAILSVSVATRLFPDGAAIGRRVRIGTQPYRQDLEVVGIVSDARLYDIKDVRSPAVYVPVLQHGELVAGGFLVIRGEGVDAKQLERAVRSAGPDYVASSTRLSDDIATAIVQDRIAAGLAGVFGALTLLLTTMGIGGVVADTVARQTKGIAIRAALGADRRRIATGVIAEGVAIAGVGTAIGLVAGVASTRFVRALLVGVDALDPAVLAGVPILLLLAAVCACVLPARRAAAADPAVGLRAE